MGSNTTRPAYGLYINGRQVSTKQTMDVLDKYTLQPAYTVAVAEKEHVHEAIAAARDAFKQPLSPYERFSILAKASALLKERRQEFADTLAAEVGKPLRDCFGEVDRAAMTLLISAEEARRIHGQGVPVEAAPGSENRMAFSIRVPVGVIAAITPFNAPLNLVCHKVGPALAAGNSVVLKPSELTPVVALKLAELFADAGLPAGRLNVVTGDGPAIGACLVESPLVNMFSFTGSVRVGLWLKQQAGLRKVSLELGNNSANIVHFDCDLDHAVEMVANKGFNTAGQVCISVQRVYVHESVKEEFVSKLKARTEAFVVGDPRDDRTDIGPMIAVKEAERVESWVREAIEQGAVLVTGGKREGALYYPTILTEVKPDMKVCRQEIFGPVVAVDTYSQIDEVIAKVNDSDYGLQAGLFTRDLNFAMKAAKEIEVGGLIVNDASAYRVDHMPYGGVKNSGTGKEGPAYAIEEMTEEKLIVLNL
ncbi:aldehyde dehydrogenase family protein [Paenibacillus ginsengihumi]|uniref:aldehyde dehydrogenase family protein n=1 Tax=Paenibacillus ginsengihumi TaxID=431596 RepID=UPI000369138C|nr:aldehyde dehydrogenase family protein [Paenibacillus ginsengihumi]